jgi:hypothetical protein
MGVLTLNGAQADKIFGVEFIEIDQNRVKNQAFVNIRSMKAGNFLVSYAGNRFYERG